MWGFHGGRGCLKSGKERKYKYNRKGEHEREENQHEQGECGKSLGMTTISEELVLEKLKPVQERGCQEVGLRVKSVEK
ncbi:hypothetical protein VNO78_11028 [Psophocarpus tetragonolobus]|uniref:Uncharacterized protein n=1 Tax=Psophocarpus tetragonolobus TaxID=3891 RepID=A0AAN9XNA3_PSOTE